MSERRRHPRVTLRKPVRASLDDLPVFVLDVSRGGLRVVHQSDLPPGRSICRVEVPMAAGPLRLDCAVVHTTAQHATLAAQELFSTGLRVVSAGGAAEQHLEALIAAGKKEPRR